MIAPRIGALVVLAAVTCAAASCGDGAADTLAPGSPFGVRIVSMSIGDGAGFGSDRLPDVVLGPPRGAGTSMGSLDVLSLGIGGEIVIELGTPAEDGPGADILVFENAFYISGSPDNVYAEPGFVALSEDGEHFVELGCEPSARPYAGCAGAHPVLANPDANEIDPLDPTAAGGDAFDLLDAGLARALFVRIRDAGLGRISGAMTDGFDLDAVAVARRSL